MSSEGKIFPDPVMKMSPPKDLPLPPRSASLITTRFSMTKGNGLCKKHMATVYDGDGGKRALINPQCQGGKRNGVSHVVLLLLPLRKTGEKLFHPTVLHTIKNGFSVAVGDDILYVITEL